MTQRIVGRGPKVGLPSPLTMATPGPPTSFATTAAEPYAAAHRDDEVHQGDRLDGVLSLTPIQPQAVRPAAPQCLASTPTARGPNQ
jgi:hypothetical protein